MIILIDDDETPYIIYGDKEGGGYHIARLNEDMISLAEKPKPIEINGEEWESAPNWMDKNYLFKHLDTYYLSWGSFYATSGNIYGPYECEGSVGEGYNLNAFAHSSFFSWKGQFYHTWCYYIKNPSFKYRSTIITYCHFDDNGKVITDTNFLDKHFSNGVGQYNASWPKIEAEWFYEISGNIQKQGNREEGFVLSNIRDGDWIRFANVTFEKKFRNLTANVSLNGKNGEIEIRTDNPNGELIGKICLEGQDKSDSFFQAPCNLNGVNGRKDIYLVFKCDNETKMNLDWIKFESGVQ